MSSVFVHESSTACRVEDTSDDLLTVTLLLDVEDDSDEDGELQDDCPLFHAPTSMARATV